MNPETWYTAMKKLAVKWRQRGCAEKTIGVLLVDENEANGRPLSYTAMATILRSVMARGIA